MNDMVAVGILRNPFGFSDEEVRQARQYAADVLYKAREHQKLFQFYEVGTVSDLIKEQSAHIVRLQQRIDQLSLTQMPPVWQPPSPTVY